VMSHRKGGRVPHQKKLNQPLVALNGDRLKGALETNGLTVRGSVRALREQGIRTTAPTIGGLIRGLQRRCHEEVFEGLVQLLRGSVPADRYRKWLSGTSHTLRNLPASWLLQAPQGWALPLNRIVTDASGYSFPIDGAEGRTLHPLRPGPGYILEADRLNAEIVKSWQADLRDDVRSAHLALRKLGKDYPNHDPWTALSAAVESMLSCAVWRRELLERPWQLPVMATPAAEASWERDTDEFARLLAMSLRVLLRPWLSGQGSLNYLTFVGLCRRVLASLRVMLGQQ